MDETLDNKYTEFANVLFETKGILDIHKTISLNAEEINAKGYSSFFWLIDRLAVKDYAINICMLLEEPKKRYLLNSIHGILSYLENQKISDSNSSIIESYIHNKTGNLANSEFGYVEQLRKIVDCFCKEKETTLERFKHVRDKEFVHSESISIEERIKDLPSYNEMEQIFSFCYEFIRTVSIGFLNVVPHKIIDDTRFSRNLCKLLLNAGIEKVETEFSD